MKKSPYLPADDNARALAQALLQGETTAALGVILPDSGAPYVSRIAFSVGPDGAMVSLMSSLALHTRALHDTPECSILLGTPPGKGDPLAFARITIAARAHFLAGNESTGIRAHYLKHHPKARLYADFADFSFVRFVPSGALVNGGFGKAYKLDADDLLP